MSDEDKAAFMPNGRMLGRKPTFKEFVDLKMSRLDQAIEKEASTSPFSDLEWDESDVSVEKPVEFTAEEVAGWHEDEAV